MTEATPEKRPFLLNVAIALGVLVVACILFYAAGLNRVALSFLPPIEGQEAVIRTSNNLAIVAADLAAYQAAGRVGTEELQRMRTDGQVFLVANGTRVRVLEATAQYYRVQILDGGFRGNTGYVPASFVQR